MMRSEVCVCPRAGVCVRVCGCAGAQVYAGTWSRVYEREVRSACEAARAALSAAHAHAQPGVRARSLDDPLDNVSITSLLFHFFSVSKHTNTTSGCRCWG